MGMAQTNPPKTVFSHDVAVAFRQLKTAFWRQVWLRAGSLAADKPIAIFGGGQHTRKLLRFLQGQEGGPSVRAILDDAPHNEFIREIPVIRPDQLSPDEVALVLVSSDWIEAKLTERARQWCEDTLPVLRIYDQLPVETLHSLETAGEIIEVLQDGTRHVTDEDGVVSITPELHSENRAPSAIRPVEERRIWAMRTPGYEVGVLQVTRELDEMFKPHQIYPGDRHRPNIDLRDEDFATHREPGLVTKDTRVSVIGSCFAANFRSWLIQNDYNFSQFEDGAVRCVRLAENRPAVQHRKRASAR